MCHFAFEFSPSSFLILKAIYGYVERIPKKRKKNNENENFCDGKENFLKFFKNIFLFSATSPKPVDGCLQLIPGILEEVSTYLMVGKLLKIKMEKRIMSSEHIFLFK